MADEMIDLLEMEGYDRVVGAVSTYRYCTGLGLVTEPAETPPHTPYAPFLLHAPEIRLDAFDEGTTRGRSRVGYGDAVLKNDGSLDGLTNVSFDGRPWYRRRGPRNGAYPSEYPIVAAGVTERAEVTMDVVTVKLRDRMALLEVPFQTTKYAGDNALPAGLEGVEADLKGKPKPEALGRPSKVTPHCVNTAKQIWQFSHGSVFSIAGLKDRGIALLSGHIWATRTSPYGGGAHVLYDAAYGAGTWVIVGTGAATALIGFYSTDDGASWSNITFPAGMAGTSIPCIHFGNGKFVVSNGNIGWSTDGVTWTASTGIPNTAGANNVYGRCGVYATHLSLHVLVGSRSAGPAGNGQTLTSPDAITWTQVDPGINATLQKVAYNGSLLVAIYQQATSGVAGGIISSPDAANYIVRSTAFNNGDFNALTYDITNRQFVANALGGGSQPNIGALSPDGITYERRPPFIGTTVPTDDVNWLASGNGATLSLNLNGWVSSTVDGRTWVARQRVSTGKTFLRIVFGNTSFLLLGVDGSGNGFIYQSVPTTYANTTDLLDDALAPHAGAFMACPSAGMVRLGLRPSGALTGNVIQGESGNLALRSQEFDNGTWTKNASTISANATTAPDGTTTADKLQEDNTNATHYISQVVTCPLGQYTYSVFVKAAERTKCVLDLSDNITGNVTVLADLAAGTIGAVASGGSWTGATATIKARANGWYRIAVTGLRGAGTQCLFLVYTYTTTPTYLGTTGSGIYVWGAQLNAGSFAYKYSATTDAIAGPHVGTAQMIEAILERAGRTSADWSAADLMDLDTDQPAEVELHVSEETTCLDALDRMTEGPGVYVGPDRLGIFRAKRLEDPAPNLVTSPDTITAGAGWTLGGSVAGTPAYSTVDDVLLTRLTNLTTGDAARVVTLTGDTAKRYKVVLQWDGVAGDSYHGLYDNTAAAILGAAHIVWAADGSATATAYAAGSIVRFSPRDGHAYVLVIDTIAVNTAHTNVAYANFGSAIASLRVGRITVEDTLPDAVIVPDQLTSPLERRESNDADRGLPTYRSTVRYARNYTILTTDLAANVTAAERAEFAQEWRDAVATDASVQTASLLAPEQIVESSFSSVTDAAAEATRLQALRGVVRGFFNASVDIDDPAAALNLFARPELVHSRFGLAGGKTFRILGSGPADDPAKVKLLLWG